MEELGEGSQAGFLYTDDVCLVESKDQDTQTIVDSISVGIKEYGMEMNEEKSNML